MSAAAANLAGVAPRAPSLSPSPWLFGPVADLGLGCGLGYIALLVALCFVGEQVRTGMAPGILPLLTVVFGAPHYGATLLRVYQRREDRRAYALFSVWATALLAVAFVAGTRSAAVGSLLLTLYLTWSPWHYTGQNYGLAVLFLRRRGVALAPAGKRLVYAAFVLSFALTFVVMHVERTPAAYAPTLFGRLQMLSLGIPTAAGAILVPVLAALWGLLTLAAVAWLALRASPRTLLPALTLMLTQALWFPIPAILRHWGIAQHLEPFSVVHSTHYFFYAALGHSVQYCWVTSYYARNSPGFPGIAPYLGRALLAGAAIWTVPPLLFAPDWLGRLPYDAGLGALVASVVNLHHFVLDGAIWKLRDGRIARILVRNERAAEPALARAARRRPSLAPLVWALGGLSLAVILATAYEDEFGLRRAHARGDVARMRKAAERLDWMGRESANVDYQLGRLLASRGDAGRALVAYRRSVELLPTAEAWLATADLLEQAGQLAPADQALGRALDLAPEMPGLAFRAGRLAATRGDRDRARALFERAIALEPDKKIYRMSLERLIAGEARAAATP